MAVAGWGAVVLAPGRLHFGGSLQAQQSTCSLRDQGFVGFCYKALRRGDVHSLLGCGTPVWLRVTLGFRVG